MTITWRVLWDDTARLLGDRAVARWLCEEASGTQGADFVGITSTAATEGAVHRLDTMIGRVRAGEPVQYVLGHWSFRHLDLLVDSRVLIPRPETELLVDLALGCAPRPPAQRTIVDLGTGSGAIGLSLVHELPLDGTAVWMTDASVDALDVARANAAGVGRRAVNARFALGSWFDALPSELRGQVDVIVTNPPYVARDDVEVDDRVVGWEPHDAVFAADGGHEAIDLILAGAPEWLRPGGSVIVEIGHRQGGRVLASAADHGLHDARIVADLAGRDRFLIASVGTRLG